MRGAQGLPLQSLWGAGGQVVTTSQRPAPSEGMCACYGHKKGIEREFLP